jgi:transcriptional coactivator HFI1/ADA1
MPATVTSAELHGSPPPLGISMKQLSNHQPNGTPQPKPIKLVSTTAPRIDVEPLYTQLKSAIGDNWPLYKLSVAEFAIGKMILTFACHCDSVADMLN